MKNKIAFIGAGNMAEALVRGLLESGFPPERITASDPAEARRRLFRDRFGVEVFAANADSLAGADEVVLAIKPQVAGSVLGAIPSAAWAGKLVISVMAGVPTGRIEKWVGEIPVIRVMPNTPALAGAGISALSAGRWAGKVHVARARSILETVGKVIELPEKQMNIVTALSGSGPAYFYALAEALAEAGQAEGLSPETAEYLARETLIGAGELLRAGGLPPGRLRERVTSPGGTTEAALKVFRERDLEGAVRQAVAAARSRGDELGGVD